MLSLDASTIFLSVWQFLLSGIMAIVGFNLKSYSDEQKRLQILLNRTREEIARDNVTQAELDRINDHIDQRFNRLETKIDQLIESNRKIL